MVHFYFKKYQTRYLPFLEVAPYIALTEMYDASLKMLDTVNNSLSDKVKRSDYGKRFQEYLSKIKK